MDNLDQYIWYYALDRYDNLYMIVSNMDWLFWCILYMIDWDRKYWDTQKTYYIDPKNLTIWKLVLSFKKL